MPTYVYKGICKDHRERAMDAYMASIRPQDPRGRKPIYAIDQKDKEEVKEKKRERVKKWLAERKAEYAKTIDDLDAKTSINDQLGKAWVFEKGKPVKVPADNLVAKEIEAKINALNSPFIQWERVEEKKGDEKPPKA